MLVNNSPYIWPQYYPQYSYAPLFQLPAYRWPTTVSAPILATPGWYSPPWAQYRPWYSWPAVDTSVATRTSKPDAKDDGVLIRFRYEADIEQSVANYRANLKSLGPKSAKKAFETLPRNEQDAIRDGLSAKDEDSMLVAKEVEAAGGKVFDKDYKPAMVRPMSCFS
ncbi:MAG: hypothetical protein V4691_07585 [Pseudomonadota bacterium]